MVIPHRTHATGGRPGRGIRRTVVSALAALALAAGTSAITASADLASVNLSCNEGTNLSLGLDVNTLQELEDSVQAMVIYPAGIACSVTQLPSSSNTVAYRLAHSIALDASADAGGPNEFAAGSLHLFFSQCALGDTNMNLTAHAPITGNDIPGAASGQMTQNTASAGCQGHISAAVDCLFVKVVDSTTTIATVTGKVTDATGIYTPDVGLELDWTITDHPSPTTDGFMGDVGPPCTPARTPYTVESGNVVVGTG